MDILTQVTSATEMQRTARLPLTAVVTSNQMFLRTGRQPSERVTNGEGRADRLKGINGQRESDTARILRRYQDKNTSECQSGGRGVTVVGVPMCKWTDGQATGRR